MPESQPSASSIASTASDSSSVSPSALALAALSPSDIAFIKSLEKAELHAHLNGCIPLSVLWELAEEWPENDAVDGTKPDRTTKHEIYTSLHLLSSFSLNDISEFFSAFRTIYALISTPDALRRATKGVLESFLGPAPAVDGSYGLDGTDAECTYLELRTTPRISHSLTATQYVYTVLDEIERYPSERAAMILSMDRRMPIGKEVDDGEGRNDHDNDAGDGQDGGVVTISSVITLAIGLKNAGRRVVGVDLCGDPLAGDIALLAPHIARAQRAGLGVTLHIAETPANPPAETLKFLSYAPHRLGHATFLDSIALQQVFNSNLRWPAGKDGQDAEGREGKMVIEICLSSNLICKTVPTLSAHHLHTYLDRGHPVAICTDDTLPFRTTLTAEYALLLAPPPAGLGMGRDEVERLASGSFIGAFGR